MQWLSPTLLAIQVVSSLAIIVLVLLQQGKGSEMGSAFGSGSAGSLFGATGAANFLSRTTKWCAIIFFVTTGAMAYMAHHPGSSALDDGLMQGFKSAPAPVPATGSAVPSVPGSAPAAKTAPAPAAATTPKAQSGAASSGSAVPSTSGAVQPSSSKAPVDPGANSGDTVPSVPAPSAQAPATPAPAQTAPAAQSGSQATPSNTPDTKAPAKSQ